MNTSIDLDRILMDLGKFGKFQKRNYVLLCLAIAFAAFPMCYIFISRQSKYRCFVEECDDDSSKYSEKWLDHVIPQDVYGYKHCAQFIYIQNTTRKECSIQNFIVNETKSCDKFVFENGDLTIEKDLNILCENKLWMLTAVGTINTCAESIFLPIFGYFSDRYGRRTMLITGVLASTILGIMKSLSPTYLIYILMELLDTSFASGVAGTVYILALELVVSEHRVLGNTLISCSFAVGEAVLGIAAWISPSWRFLLLLLYTPGTLFILYYFYMHESIRWLLSKSRKQEVMELIKKASRINGRRISESYFNDIFIESKEFLEDVPALECERKETMADIFKSRVILIRLTNCSFIWIACTFVYYGLQMQSVAVSGNIYLNFILVALVEMPAYLISYFTLDKYGRRTSIVFSLVVSGSACIIFIFIKDNLLIKIILFLFGKFAITIAYTALFIYTTELFPTTLRNSMLGICTMFGRLGTMVAPQIPLMAKVWESLPMFLFGMISILSGLTSLSLPETLNTKLPDTLQEAITIGERL